MKEISEVIKFLEDYVIECSPGDGCGRCNEARECVDGLKNSLRDELIKYTNSEWTYDSVLAEQAVDDYLNHCSKD